ncbi:DUF551 domain-containing protein [Enterobacter sp. DTU_2021_1002640_1_SI_PRY_ASU_LCPMC_013]|uniref:DUF551 domain-containing protein n=1 Tax=Enterobacter sp. DTU_2021_1002640_1_SI_PRY_ASU_LCPMC_013 TaxID=3077940 RepID=UPI0028ECE8E4|nr:DUF551 domain-containing protein [Enterobacter sp. DTU_2021_1002640_1_SI_PRY_ASU_LCPMC_013]WNU98591.1 DUF551 domain-containing protein [Enterobacter sp. DTU_2021_1002640_1_SI_PRY_ASU_LCPMC_013]
MSTTLKEWLVKTIMELEEERDAVPGAVNEDAANALAAMKLALASLEAEPVFEVEVSGNHWLNAGPVDDSDFSGMPDGVNQLYSAPPAPVSVPDELLSAMEEVLRISDRDHEAWHKVKAGILSCRAAMLQGAENAESPTTMQTAPALDSSPKIAESPSGNYPVIQDGWVACSERMPHIGVPVITCCGDVVQYAAYAWDGKEWQDWYEEYDKLPASTFTHWHPRPAAPQQEVK